MFTNPDVGTNPTVNDAGMDGSGHAQVFADDSTNDGVARVTVPSISGCGRLQASVYVSNVLKGSSYVTVRSVDTNADGVVDGADGGCDINYDGSANSTDADLIAAHPDHSHRNVLHGTIVRRTNLSEIGDPEAIDHIGEGDESWSPDGRTIAFSKRDSVDASAPNTCAVYLVASDPADGDTLRKFSFPGPNQHDYDPSWSPLGTPIVWDRRDSVIIRKGVAGLDSDTAEHAIYAVPSDEFYATQVAISPDGKNVAFVSNLAGASHIFVVPIEGGSPVQVTSSQDVVDDFPQWSPDGSTILFNRYTSVGPRSDLYEVNYPPTAPGGDAGRAVYQPSSGWARFAACSADGKMVLTGIGPVHGPLFALNTIDPVLGTSAPAILNYSEYMSSCLHPRQSPDGTRTAFLSAAPGVDSMYGQIWAVRRNMDLPPVISSVGGQTINHEAPVADFTIGQDSTLSIADVRSDPEGNALADSAYLLKRNLGMSFTPSTQTLSWPVGDAPVGVYTVKFAVTEASGGTDYALARITVRDMTRPAVISDLDFDTDPDDCTLFHLHWTAPGDDSSLVASGPATQYNLKSSSSSIDSNWTGGTTLSLAPGTPGTTQTTDVTVGEAQHRYIRLKTRDDNNNWSVISNQVQIDGPPHNSDCLPGGDMFAGGEGGDGARARPVGPASIRQAGGAQPVENTLLNGIAKGTWAGDLLGLPALAAAGGSTYSVRIREAARRLARLDDARLLTVDHSSSVTSFLASGKPVLGNVVAPISATDGTQSDVTALVDGSTADAFVGDSGAVLTVQLRADSAAAPGPVVIEASGLGSPSTGILLQLPDGSTGWNTVAWLHPRLYVDQLAVDSISSAQVRLFFLGKHQVRFAGRVVRSSEQPTLQWAQLVRAHDSGQGDVLAALTAADTASANLAGPDTLLLSFAAPPLAEGQVRDCFLAVDATPLAPDAIVASPMRASGLATLPTRFALWQNQPNPFSASTTIRFDLPVGAIVRLEIFDILGRRVKAVANQYYPAGYQAVQWDRRDEGGGIARPSVYLYRLTAGAYRAQKKLVLLP